MFRVSIWSSVQKSIDHYIEEWARRFHDFQEEWGVRDGDRENVGEKTVKRMRENFMSKIESLADTRMMRVYSLAWSQVKQVLIPSHGIFLFLTYEEDEWEKMRYITDIEILRK
jgi:hypothetical protein